MEQPITEHDLEGLIEGDLPPERERSVRAALGRDRVLTDKLARMQSQRSLLKELADQMNPEAPDHLADAAIAAARSEQMEQFAGATATAGRIRGARDAFALRRQRQMLAAAAFGMVLIGGWVWFMVGRVGPTASRAELPSKHVPLMDISKPPAAPPKAPDVELADVDRVDEILASAGLAPPVTEDFVGPLAPDQKIIRKAPATLARDTALLDEWLKNLNAPDASPSTLDAPTLVRLAQAGRLVLEVDAGTTDEVRRKLVAFASGRGGELIASARPPTSAGMASPDATVGGGTPLRLALDSASGGDLLAAELDALRRDVSKQTSAPARFVEAPPPATQTPGAAMDAGDLLWWTRPPDQWRAKVHLSIPVRVRAPTGTTPH